MAFDFNYQVDLIVTHPCDSIDALVKAFPQMLPTVAVSVGQERLFKSGRKRIAERSAWIAPLHIENSLSSESVDISSSMRLILNSLEPHRALFEQYSFEGYVAIRIRWASITETSAGVLASDVLGILAILKMNLEIEFCFEESDNSEELPVYGPTT